MIARTRRRRDETTAAARYSHDKRRTPCLSANNASLISIADAARRPRRGATSHVRRDASRCAKGRLIGIAITESRREKLLGKEWHIRRSSGAAWGRPRLGASGVRKEGIDYAQRRVSAARS